MSQTYRQCTEAQLTNNRHIHKTISVTNRWDRWAAMATKRAIESWASGSMRRQKWT